jgi:hypothetical protein
VRSLTESIDASTPSGRLIFHVFEALGEFEKDLIPRIRHRCDGRLTGDRRTGEPLRSGALAGAVQSGTDPTRGTGTSAARHLRVVVTPGTDTQNVFLMPLVAR